MCHDDSPSTGENATARGCSWPFFHIDCALWSWRARQWRSSCVTHEDTHPSGAGGLFWSLRLCSLITANSPSTTDCGVGRAMTRHPSGGGVPSWPKRPPPTAARGGAVATAAALFDERRPPSGHGAPGSGRHPVSLMKARTPAQWSLTGGGTQLPFGDMWAHIGLGIWPVRGHTGRIFPQLFVAVLPGLRGPVVVQCQKRPDMTKSASPCLAAS